MPIDPMPYAARINRLLQFTVTKNSPSEILVVISTFTGRSAAKFPVSHWVVLLIDEKLINSTCSLSVGTLAGKNAL